MPQYSKPTAWVGWIFFGATMMVILGMLHITAGLVAVFNSDFYVATSVGVIAFDYTTWGWIHILAGVLLLATSGGILSGATWARVSGVLFASLAVIVNVAFLPTTPLWSIIGIIVGCAVVYALAMHGDEVKE